MVDEYQDTNRAQYELLTALAAKHRNLCVVGDDDQSIYSWRGADIRNITELERDFPKVKVVRLEQNYRSTETILNAANTVIANNLQRREKSLWSGLGKGRKIDWFVTGDEDHEAAEAVKWLRHIQSRTGAKPADFAILYRSNQQAHPFEIGFRQAGIPYVVVGGQEFFERAEIKDLVAYLKVVANPRDEASFLRVVNMPKRGIGDATLHQVHELCLRDSVSLVRGLARLLEQGTFASNTAHGIRSFLKTVRDFREEFRSCNGKLSHVVSDLVEAIDYRTELFRTCKSKEQFQARWMNVEALISAVATYETSAARPSLSGFLDQSALAKDEDRRDKEERMGAGVKLMTIHGAKGLEFPFVFVVGVEEGLLPHEKSVDPATIEEERRLFYVALTRGKRHVTLFEALSRQRNGRQRMSKTSRFAAEIPEKLVTKRVKAAKSMVEQSLGVDRPRKTKERARRR
jgi:superfamily I DNA/RNA helicase